MASIGDGRDGRDGRKDDIARAVLAVVARSGTQRATLRDIAREAGYTTGVIGYYFDGRDDLFAHAHRYAHEQILGHLGVGTGEAEEAAGAEDAEVELGALLGAWTAGDDTERAASLLWIDWVLSDRAGPAEAAAVEEVAEDRRRRVRAALGDDLAGDDLELAVDGLLAAAEGLAMHALVDGDALDPAERRALLARLAG